MRILFQSRVDLYNPGGGDTLQMEKTKEAIEKLDPSVKIDIIPEIQVENIDDYDIVHIFNLDWVCESYPQAAWAKEHNKPVVLSAIHHSEKEVLRYENEARYDIRRIYNFLIPSQSMRDIGKNIYRSIFNWKKIKPTILQIKQGIRNQQRELVKLSDVILVQSELEAEDIKTDFGVKDFSWALVVNGVDYQVFNNPDPSVFNGRIYEKYGINLSNSPILLNVGRIEPRKNQLSVIEAFERLLEVEDFKKYYLVFIGDFSTRSPEYTFRFKQLVSENPRILHLSAQPQSVVASAMAHEGIYVHPSWFETTGLVCLEASLAGMSVVASGDRVREYLGDSAFYCDPGSVEDIQNAIIKSHNEAPDRDSVKDIIAKKFTWDEAARQTLEVYKKLLS